MHSCTRGGSYPLITNSSECHTANLLFEYPLLSEHQCKQERQLTALETFRCFFFSFASLPTFPPRFSFLN